MQNLQIYKASAGSGKTHLLTQSFLKLAFENPDNFSKILAVTFTNKAAEEMKERIILEINNIIEIGNSAAHFSDIKEYTNLSDEKLIQFALEIRTNILHNYSMFMVSTIDSFVQKVIRSFSFEIGIASNYRIELDNNKVIDDLTNLLFQNTENDKQLLYWLIKFAEYKIKKKKNWDFRDEISKLATEIFKEKFQAINSTLSLSKNQIIENKKLLVEFLSTITVVKTEFQLKMKNLSDKAKLCVSNSGINIESLGRNFKTISNFLLNKQFVL